MTEIDPNAPVPIAFLASLFGVTTRQARNLLEGAKVKSSSRGHWPLADAVKAVTAKAREDRTGSEYMKARARAINAKALQTEMLIDEKQRVLVPVEDAFAAQDMMLGIVLQELNGLPARLTRDVDLRRKIEAEISASRIRMLEATTAAALAVKTGNLPANYT